MDIDTSSTNIFDEILSDSGYDQMASSPVEENELEFNP